MLKKGLLFVFEGIDGAGKSTQAKLLSDFLINKGYKTYMTREPSDSMWGKKIRELSARDDYNLSLEEELDLFIKDRKYHLREVINPLLNEKKIVITDRYYFSTIAYQGAKGLKGDLLMSVKQDVVEPDLVLYLKISPEVGIDRIKNGRNGVLTCFERLDYLKLVSHTFDTFNDDFFHKIDASFESTKISEKINRISMDVILKNS